ncbi:CDP-glycerol glycerophosphotransferase family protein [Streptomyces sp. G44]|uniref:bifunctional glycosyltransferase/CDP-glycerol:glycerophosphate glycerophosphotransferase n=1 Tax=Streptomyces sp. G44 TaxID=2807632 RepID=UPI0019612DCD|nr:bifunctional glycosyltransferase family 2 protein/CDP-glycerol:glycerophosphate glycerophosphotransferase [Streptomyces sp. G44]MBM7171605.1 CDP-glycerol glycerophosphotransferase family protein [Streptomyces sp. G44]
MQPRLSVVVPVYNVELYLDECLESLAAQTFTDFEVVMVDDGSTDGSAAIAGRFAAADPRFRLISQENKGLGAARNTGVREMSPHSEYLAFVDSDDTLPATAYALLIETLDETGSDFAAGNVTRFRSAGYVQSPVHRVPFAATRLRTHVSKFRPLLTDRTAWNKVYRRSFWEEHRLAYPEAMLYEDAPVSVPAHYLADAVDVLSEPIYNWREREIGERSITQNRTNPQGLIDRVKSIRMVREFLLARVDDDPMYAEHLRVYDNNALAEEIPLFWRVLPGSDAAYQEAFLEHVGRLVREIGQDAVRALHVPHKLKLYLTVHRRLDELIAQLEFEKEHGGSIPVSGTLHPKADYPFLDPTAPVPDAVLRLGPELRLRSRLDEAAWHDGKLWLSGWAFPRQLGAESRSKALKSLILKEKGSRRTVLVPARSHLDPEATVASGAEFRHADWAGFGALVNPARLRHRGRWVDGLWYVRVAVAGTGSTPRRGPLYGAGTGSGQTPPAHWVTEDVRVAPQIQDGELAIRVETAHARALEVRAEGTGLLVRGVLRTAPEGAARLRMRHRESGTIRTVPLDLGVPREGRVPFTAQVDTAALTEVREDHERLRPTQAERSIGRWDMSVEIVTGNEAGTGAGAEAGAEAGAKSTRLALILDDREGFSGAQFPHGDRAMYARRSPGGYLQLCDQPAQPLVDRVSVAPDGTVTLTGSYPAQGACDLELVLRQTWSGHEYTFPARARGGRFEASFVPAPTHRHAGGTPLRAGFWWPSVQKPDGSRTAVQLAPPVHAQLPLEVVAHGKRVELQVRQYDQLALMAHSELRPDERSRYRQTRLRTEAYPAARHEPLREAVLYDVFGGRMYGDSPRAIHEEMVRRGLPLEHLWVVKDGQCEVPPTAKAVRVHSPEYYEAMARSRYIVGNTHFPRWLERREGQQIVQTWHGTPLKRIGFDFDNDHFASTQYLLDLDRERHQWTMLLSPNRFSTPIMRSAFRFGDDGDAAAGELLEAGYPRNDVLLAPDRAERAARVRRALGLPDGKKVILYAPTWREDKQRHRGGFLLDLRVDLEKARHELGDDHVLLIRPHAHIVEPVPGAGDGFVWDVASYPDIMDLLLIADVLVTDYSSVMFDFAVTGRPMLFFTYDLEHYRDRLRGFYFDFEKRAPGPLVTTSDELIAALRDVDAVREPYGQAYEEFRAAFCDLDDGQAARRVVDRMLAHRGTTTA